jgi:hypothetical protein
MEKDKTLLDILDFDGDENILLDIIDKIEKEEAIKIRKIKGMKYNYPLTLELEMYDTINKEWELVNSFLISNKSTLISKMVFLRTYYKLEGKDYRIVLIINSKMNKN